MTSVKWLKVSKGNSRPSIRRYDFCTLDHILLICGARALMMLLGGNGADSGSLPDLCLRCLIKQNVANRKKPNCGEGSSTDRTRMSITK